jgi:heptosyltransferase-1
VADPKRTAANALQSPPRRILLIRLSAIGDLVMASPLIGALRRSYPDAQLTWLVQSEMRDMLTANRELDQVIAWPRRKWRSLWRQGRWWRLLREIRAFVQLLRAQRFDVAIDIQGLLKSGIWAWLCAAPVRIGLDSREGSGRLMTHVVRPVRGDKRISSEYLHLAQALGLDSGDFHMQVAVSDEDERFAHQYATHDTGYAVLCPFTTRPQKHWREERWAGLSHALQERFGLRCLMLGGPGDAEAAARIAQEAGAELENLAGRTSIRQAAALIKHAALLIGVDTGLTHMGSAFRIPSIALFGSTCPYLETGCERSVVIYKQLDCSPCKRRPSCQGAFTCMTSISVEEVLQQADHLLEDAR